jgi:DNA polymerase
MKDVIQTEQAQGCALAETTRLEYLKAMGIQAWSLKYAPAVEISRAETVVSNEVVAPSLIAENIVEAKPVNVADMNWQQLAQQVASCQLCELHVTRTQAVLGVGNQQAELMIVGEAPGADEDRQGEPFVGRAGKLLDAMLNAIGMNRQQVYIANVLKCRPPNNRDPHISEIVCCDPYLQRQIALIQPKLILALGRIAAHHLLITQQSLGSLRGRLHNYNGIPLMVTYHPAYLLRTPLDKRKAWQDLLQVKQRLLA